MLNNFKYLILLVLLSAQMNIHAQSPYDLTWQKEGIIFGSGFAIAIPSLFVNKNLIPLTESKIKWLKTEDINAFDRFASNYYSPEMARTSDVFVVAALAAPALLLIAPEIRNDWMTIGTMYAETIILVGAVNNLTKGLSKRIRPYVYNPNAPMNIKEDKDALLSFFSGHTTITFASAIFLSQVYSDYFPHSKYKSYVWGGSLLVATTVGVLRIFSGEHFPTDVITGAAAGSLLGWLIPELHKKINTGNVNIGVSVGGISFTYVF